MSDPIVAAGLNQLFNHRKQIIILGLTGRTGSGCTTLSKILETKKFEDLDLRNPEVPPKDQEDRKYRIIFDWSFENWHPFRRISVSDLLTGFIGKLGFEKFKNFIEKLVSENQSIQNFDISSLENLEESFNDILQKIHSSGIWTSDLEVPNTPEISLSFVFDSLPSFSKLLRGTLGAQNPDVDSIFFQTIGDNIRRSGNPYQTKINPEKLFSIPIILESIINASIQIDRQSGAPTYIVIDAIRHPFEAKYLQERYAYFYLMAVTADNENRKQRLVAQQFRSVEIKRLDDKEYPKEKSENKLKGYDLLVSQDIQSSIENADIYLFNREESSSKHSPHDLKEQAIRYLSLMMHPGLITPTSQERCMQAAFTAKLNSGCISRQVGAVVADKSFSIKSIGWNDVPRGQVPCLLRNVRHLITKQDPVAYSKYEDGDVFKPHMEQQPIGMFKETHFKGRNLSYCFKTHYNSITGERNQVHTRSLHAEENAFLQLAKGSGQISENGYLFTTASPCELCAKKAFQLGVSKIYFIDPYPGISTSHVLASGIEDHRPELVQFRGAIGRTYHQLFSPIMPIKDELEFLIPNQESAYQKT